MAIWKATATTKPPKRKYTTENGKKENRMASAPNPTKASPTKDNTKWDSNKEKAK